MLTDRDALITIYADRYGLPSKLLRALDSVEIGADIESIAQRIDELIENAGSGEKALAAHHWGPDNLKHCVEEFRDQWREHLPEETRSYIEAVQARFAELMAAGNT